MADSAALSRSQVREVDRKAIEAFGIPGIVLMENAGRNATRHVLDVLPRKTDAHVLILGGTGNNGGDAWVVARHLHNAGRAVTTCLCGDESRLSRDGGINYRILRNMRLPRVRVESIEQMDRLTDPFAEADVIVDGLLGTGFSGQVREPIATLIRRINAQTGKTVIALDVPSGLDCDTGQPADPTVRADVTVTFVARKVGFDAAPAKAYLGRVVVAGIGAPRELIETVAHAPAHETQANESGQ